MSDIKKQLDDRIRQLNENAGRGRGPQVWKGAKSTIDDFTRSLSMDYLNRSSPNLSGKEVPYNFNNYYTLDVRIPTDKLINAWNSGEETYETIFDKLVSENPQYDKNLLFKLKDEFRKFYVAQTRKASISKSATDDIKLEPYHDVEGNPEYGRLWENLETAIEIPAIEAIYNDIPVVSIYNPLNSDGRPAGQESIAIKTKEFVPLIMGGMQSAVRGNIPQGVTIEEVLEGKFSRKAIAPEQGTFINRVKDPTSDKDFEFRSWKTETLEELHNLIMDTFKRDTSLKLTVPEVSQLLAKEATRSSLFLYMTQEDFNKLEKGGQGFKNLAKSTLDYMQAKAPKLNI